MKESAFHPTGLWSYLAGLGCCHYSRLPLELTHYRRDVVVMLWLPERL